MEFCQANLPYRVPPPSSAKSAEQVEAQVKAKASRGEPCDSDWTGRGCSRSDRRQFRIQRMRRQHMCQQHLRRQWSQHVQQTRCIRAISVAGPAGQFLALAD